jgi:hypothetical protein
MTERTTTTFPLTERPTRYIACVSNDGAATDCTHVFIKFTPETIFRLVWMSLVGVKISVFEIKPGKLNTGHLRYTGWQTLKPDQETSPDDAPYSCLSIGELASLGGYATEAVLKKYFAPIKKDLQAYAIEVHVARHMVWLKVHLFGPNPSVETDPFNLDIIVKDILDWKGT